MQLIKLVKDKRDNIQIYLLCLIAATIPFSLKYGNIAVIITITFNILFFQKENFKQFKYFKSWYLVVFFLITVASALFSKDFKTGLKHLDLTLLLLLFSIIFANTRITKEVTHKVLSALYVTSVLCTLVLIVNALYKFVNGVSIKELTFHEFTRLFDQHPVYYSMYLSLAMFYVCFISSKEIKKIFKGRLLFFTSLVIISIGLVFCASKAVLVINLIAFFSFYILKNQTRKNKIIFLLLVPVLCVLIYNVPFVKDRFESGLRFNKNIALFQPTNDFNQKKQFTYDEKTDISDLELRYILGKINIYHATKDEKLLFGYGQGDTRHYFNYYFFTYNLGPNWYENFNVHNQFIHFLVMYGFFVLLFFIAYLIYSFKLAIHKKDALQFYFLLLTCFVFIFEVVLVRNKGIIFFYFFNSLFLFNTNNLENSNTRDKRHT